VDKRIWHQARAWTGPSPFWIPNWNLPTFDV